MSSEYFAPALHEADHDRNPRLELTPATEVGQGQDTSQVASSAGLRLDDLRLGNAYPHAVEGSVSIPGSPSASKPTFLRTKTKSFHAHVPEAEILEIEEKIDSIVNSGLLPDDVDEWTISEFLGTNPKLIKLLKKYDKDGNGELDMKELAMIFGDLAKRRHQVHVMRRVIAFAVLLVIILLVANTLLTLWMLKVTQVVSTTNDNNYLTNRKGDLVVTDKPRYYVSISDLSSLPPKALNALTRLSFATVDGSLHNYDVQGIRFGSPTNDSVSLFFTSTKKLVVTGKQAIFNEVVEESGQYISLGVATDRTVEYQRRLQLVQGMSGSDSENLATRCSLDHGVCYHTFEEMLQLNGKASAPVDAEVDVYGNRRLKNSDPTVTYAEVSADAVALTADSRNALLEAKNFLSAIFSALNVSTSNTAVISFHMLDRCINYNTLVTRCKRPAPISQNYVSNNAAVDPYTVPPFFGLIPNDGKWYFDDEVVYSKDINTIQLKVRYAHDPLKEKRMHVVMVDRNNPTHIISYDEVSTPVASITNFKLNAIDDSGGLDGISPTTGVSTSRRLQLVDDAFHKHVSNKLAGFPDIMIPEELLGESGEDRHRSLRSVAVQFNDRLLDASDDTDTGPVIEVQTKFSTDSYCLVPLTDKDLEKYGNSSLNTLPCTSTGKVASGTSDPVASFYSVGTDSVPGLIQWPVASMSIQVPEFDDVPIIPRAALQKYLDSHVKANAPPKLGVARKLSSGFSYHMYDADVQEEDAGTHRSLRGENVVDESPEYLQGSIAAKRMSLKKHLEAHEKVFKDFNRRVHSIRTEGFLPTSAQCMTVQPTTQPTPSAAFTQKPTTKGDPSYPDFNTLKSNWDARLVGDSSQYLFGKYVSQNKNVDPTWFSKIPAYSVSGLSSQCSSFNSKWSTFLSLMAYYQGLIAQMKTDANNLLTDIGKVKIARDMLYDLVQIRDVMNPVAPVIGKLPYVGPLITYSFDLFSDVVSSPVKPIYNEVNNLQTQIDQRLLVCKIQRFINFLETLDNLMTLIGKANVDMQGLVIVDNYCPTNVVVQGVCSSLTVVVDDANVLLSNLKQTISTVSDFLKTFSRFAHILSDFIGKLDISVINLMGGIFVTLGKYLGSSIGFWWPDLQTDSEEVCVGVTYPCGTKMCTKKILGRKVKYPCGTLLCGQTVCTEVYYITIVNVWVSFTVSDIINGAMTVLQEIQDIMSQMLTNAIKAMGISVPTIPIPGLPGLGVVANVVNQFDSLDLDTVLGTLSPKITNVLSKMQFTVPYCN